MVKSADDVSMTTIEARLIALTQPTIETRIPSAEGLIAYAARVSSPDNQDNFDTAEKLLAYCIRNRHWSIFEMANAVVEVIAPRDITRQLLRHRSFSFQEFSQRYSDKIEFTARAVRSQDLKNRQNSVDDFDEESRDFFMGEQHKIIQHVSDTYHAQLEDGVAKECARVMLPEGLTVSRMYVNGTLRSWLHYLDVREGNGTQREHVVLANRIREILTPAFPTVFSLTKGQENE